MQFNANAIQTNLSKVKNANQIFRRTSKSYMLEQMGVNGNGSQLSHDIRRIGVYETHRRVNNINKTKSTLYGFKLQHVLEV